MLKETLRHPCFPQPLHSKIKVWRYLDISKFIWLLSYSALYFPRLDLMEDIYEGSLTHATVLSRNQMLAEKGHAGEINSVERIFEKNRKTLFVSCWAMSEHESEAMWRLYCPSHQGVALQSKYSSLVDFAATQPNHSMYIGCVTYLNYETDYFAEGNLLAPVMHKRKSFEHEKEIRLVAKAPSIWATADNSCLQAGLSYPFDIEKYIDTIYVNPYAPEWYFDVVKKTVLAFLPSMEPKIIWSPHKRKPSY